MIHSFLGGHKYNSRYIFPDYYTFNISGTDISCTAPSWISISLITSIVPQAIAKIYIRRLIVYGFQINSVKHYYNTVSEIHAVKLMLFKNFNYS